MAAHPSYNSSTHERDIAVMRIDFTQFEGPPLGFNVTPIGSYAEGAPLDPLLYSRPCAPHWKRLGHLKAELADECPTANAIAFDMHADRQLPLAAKTHCLVPCIPCVTKLKGMR